ncbi:MAG: hypothetical protein U0931_24150 [Vulcanimicrobiota bacterium]
MTAKERTAARDLELAEKLMADLSVRTEEVRCLQVDAVAVENDLQLARQKREPGFLQRARQRVERVHASLGRYREGSPIQGWLSGLDDSEASLHPTRGGLRSGAALPERSKRQALNLHDESERDGQSFRDLALWMSVLERFFRVSGLPHYLDWAEDLAQSAFKAFVYVTPAGPRMYSKMSCDLSHPLLPVMDPFDPLDGLATYLRLHSTGGSLEEECSDFAEMLSTCDLSGPEPQNLGRLLWDADRLRHYPGLTPLSEALIALAGRALPWFVRALPLQNERQLREPAAELLLAYGLRKVCSRPKARRELRAYAGLSTELLAHWSQPSNREPGAWNRRRDLNDVMLAGALLSGK